MCAIHFPLRVVLCIWEQIKVMCHPRCISNTALVDVYKCLVKMSKMSKNTYENTMKCRCIFFCLGSLFSSLYSCQLVRTPLISPATLTFPEIIMGFWHDVSINVPRVIVFLGRHVFYVRGAALVADGVRILLLNCQRKEGRSKASLCASSSCLSICTVTEQLSSGFFYSAFVLYLVFSIPLANESEKQTWSQLHMNWSHSQKEIPFSESLKKYIF